MEIPPELKHIVILHSGLDYTEFYTLMSGMDICLPAFPRNSDENFVYQASSTIAMCMENNVRVFGLIFSSLSSYGRGNVIKEFFFSIRFRFWGSVS
jgi:hypothetical protein